MVKPIDPKDKGRNKNFGTDAATTTREDAERLAVEVARCVDEICAEKLSDDVIFVVLVAGKTPGGQPFTAYCSNGERQDIANLLVEHTSKVLAS